jgi:signal transduction histidine kinase
MATKAEKTEPYVTAEPARELLWTVCHDLANQLAVVRLYTQGMLVRVRSGEAPGEGEWTKAMSRVDRVAVAAATLLEDVLRAEHGEAHPPASVASVMDFDDALDDVLTLNAELLAQAGCAVVITRDDGIARICGAWHRPSVERLLSNLLQNVARHAPGTPARIHLSIEPGWLHVSFSDAGNGLPGATTNFGHQAFLAPGGQSSHHGLGLWIIHRTVATLNGQIEMHSAPGAGLAFDIRLPLRT